MKTMNVLFSLLMLFHAAFGTANASSSSSSSSQTTPVKKKVNKGYITPTKKSTRRRLPFLTETPESATLVSSDECDIIQSLIEIFKNKRDAEIYVNSFFFTDYALASRLAQLCQKNNVKIFVLVDSRSKGHGDIALRIAADHGVHVKIYRGEETSHTKYVLWSYHDEEGNQLYRMYSGSANMTNMARKNIEQGVFEPITQEIFDERKEDFLEPYHKATRFISSTTLSDDEVNAFPIFETPPSARTKSHQIATHIPFGTPTNKTTSIIKNSHIAPSIIERIAKTVPGGQIYISAYSYNWPDFTNELLRAMRRGISVSLIVDKISLQKRRFAYDFCAAESQKQLDLLSRAGAHILIYSGPGITSHHKKLIAIQDANRIIFGQGSANFTEASKDDLNSWAWYCRHAKMFNQIKKQHHIARQLPVYIPYKTFCLQIEAKRREMESHAQPSPARSRSRMTRPTQSLSLEPVSAYPYYPLAEFPY